MGKKPDELENEIKAKREHISRRVEELEQRAENDIVALRENAQKRASEITDKAGSMLNVSESVREHPYTTLLGATGLGIALGLASEGLPLSNGNHNRGQPERSDGLLSSGLLAPILAVATDTVQDELKRLIKEGFSGVRSSS